MRGPRTPRRVIGHIEGPIALLSPAVSRLDDLRHVEAALNRIARLSTGRLAARARVERSGVELSRPAITILGALRDSGPVRPSAISRMTDLEAPLVSRELRDLVAGGHVCRTDDPTDRRAGIVELTKLGLDTWQAHRRATDDAISATFEDWSSEELSDLRRMLERVAGDFANARVEGAPASSAV